MQDHGVCRGPLALSRRGAPAPAAPVGAPRKTPDFQRGNFCRVIRDHGGPSRLCLIEDASSIDGREHRGLNLRGASAGVYLRPARSAKHSHHTELVWKSGGTGGIALSNAFCHDPVGLGMHLINPDFRPTGIGPLFRTEKTVMADA